MIAVGWHRLMRLSAALTLAVVVVLWQFGALESWGPWVGLGCVAVLVVDGVIADRLARRRGPGTRAWRDGPWR